MAYGTEISDPESAANVVVALPTAARRTTASALTPRAPRDRLYLPAVRWAVAGSDALLIAVITLFSLRPHVAGGVLDAPAGQVLTYLAAGALMMAGMFAAGAYVFPRGQRLRAHVGRTGAGVLGGALVHCVACLAFLNPVAWVNNMGVMIAACVVVAVAFHVHAYVLVREWRRAGRFADNAVVVGAGKSAWDLVEANENTGDLNILAVFGDADERTPHALRGVPVCGNIDDLLAWPQLPDIDRIVLAIPPDESASRNDVMVRLRQLPQAIAVVVDGLPRDDLEAAAAQRLRTPPSAFVSGAPPAAHRLAKRAQDIILGGLLTLGFAPIMSLVALAVRLDSPGPIFFRQARHGLNSRAVSVWKFRTMYVEDTPGPMRQVEEDDPRVTRVGRFLRKTSLDELPQLFNVLKGDMSLVGPRPHAVDMHTGAIETASLVESYAHRHRVKPGITGWAQINGSRGPMHEAKDVRQRVALDLHYIARQSLWFDIVIMAKTLPCLLGDSLNTR